MTRPITMTGGLVLRQEWGCQLGRWTAYPVLGMRPTQWSLLSRWITVTRTGNSCCAGRWTPLLASITGPSWSWCWTVMNTGMATGLVMPFRPMSGRTTVSGIEMMASARILISGMVVMTIRPRFRPGRAIGPGLWDHFHLHPAGTVTRGRLVGLWLWLVTSRLVRLTTLLSFGPKTSFGSHVSHTLHSVCLACRSWFSG